MNRKFVSQSVVLHVKLPAAAVALILSALHMEAVWQ